MIRDTFYAQAVYERLSSQYSARMMSTSPVSSSPWPDVSVSRQIIPKSVSRFQHHKPACSRRLRTAMLASRVPSLLRRGVSNYYYDELVSSRVSKFSTAIPAPGVMSPRSHHRRRYSGFGAREMASTSNCASRTSSFLHQQLGLVAVRGGSAETASAVFEGASGALVEGDILFDAPVTEEQGELGERRRRFEWADAWYAVASVDNLDTARPHAVTVLGRPMVLWRDTNTMAEGLEAGEWRCFLDRCPHRSVPLSEGRINEAGLLQCSYHGWTFGPDASCRGIPQASRDGPDALAAQSPRACAVPFPTQTFQGVLFVWPNEFGAEKAAATPLPLSRAMLEENFTSGAFTRELFYGYEFLVENLVDLSHLPFAHHGVAQLRREKATPLPLKCTAQGEWGFEGDIEVDVFPSDGTRFEFRAPSLIAYDRLMKPNATVGNEKPIYNVDGLFTTPSVPGRSIVTILVGSTLPKQKRSRLSSLRSTLFSFLSIGHLINHDVFDGDAYFLHSQERSMRSDGRKWKESYFMPTTADHFVVAYRQWLDNFGGGGVGWPEEYVDADGGPRMDTTVQPKEVVLDRFSSHTKNCVKCSKVLARLRAAQTALAVAAAILALLLAAQRAAWPLFLLPALSAAAAAALQGFIAKFIFVGYDHATR